MKVYNNTEIYHGRGRGKNLSKIESGAVKKNEGGGFKFSFKKILVVGLVVFLSFKFINARAGDGGNKGLVKSENNSQTSQSSQISTSSQSSLASSVAQSSSAPLSSLSVSSVSSNENFVVEGGYGTVTGRMDAYLKALPGNVAVYAKEIGGEGKTYAFNEEKVFTAASLYKLLEIYPLLTQLESGKITWDSKLLDDGTTVRQCVDVMIRLSDNECGIKISHLAGLKRTDELLKDIGLKNTILNNLDEEGNLASDKTTTAKDMGVYMDYLLYQGKMGPKTKELLLNSMEKQVYVQGIKAGVKQGTVYNKVGFLDEFLNDAAIVKGEGVEYILVILTEGNSWGTIAEIATMVNNFMY